MLWQSVPGGAMIHGAPRCSATVPGARAARYIGSVNTGRVTARPGSGSAGTRSYSWTRATSSSPARSAAATPAGSTSVTIGSRPGCQAASSPSTAGMIARAADG